MTLDPPKPRTPDNPRRHPDPAARFATLAAALWCAHDLADHVVAQTDHQAAHKARSGITGWTALAGHVGGYHLVQLLVIAALRTLDIRPSWRRVLAGVAVSAGSHAVLDRRWPVRRILEMTRSPGFAESAVIRVHHDVDGYGLAATCGVPTSVEAVGPLPIHGPYVADQALHHAFVVIAAAIMAGGR